MIITMTNRSISILAKMMIKNKDKKVKYAKQIIEIEYNKIIAQTRNFIKVCNTEKIANDILEFKNSEELFEYLYNLSVVDISLLSSYGIDVAFMNLLKVSD